MTTREKKRRAGKKRHPVLRLFKFLLLFCMLAVLAAGGTFAYLFLPRLRAIQENAIRTCSNMSEADYRMRPDTEIYDADGRHVAHMEKKLFTLHERHFVSMEDGQDFELSNELFHLVKDITNLEGLGWQLQGNILGLNFELYDQAGRILAVFSQKLFSLHDKYCVDIYAPQHEKTVVAILVTLQHMIRDREAASSSSSSSSSGD